MDTKQTSKKKKKEGEREEIKIARDRKTKKRSNV